MTYQGRIENWDDEKGYGFVIPDGGGTRTFVHINEFIARPRRPLDGDVIRYDIGVDAENRPQAVNVQFQFSDRRFDTGNRAKHARSIGIGGMLGLMFLCLLVVLCVLKITPIAIVLLYVLMSALTLLAYDLDKAAAKNNRWRTSETSLQLLALVGGWPGALMAQNLFHHKIRKMEFQLVFWFIVCVNCGLFALSLSDVGADLLRPFTQLSEEKPPGTDAPLASPTPTEDESQKLPIIRPLPRSDEPNVHTNR